MLGAPIHDPNAWGKRLVQIDGFIESGDGFDWHFYGLTGCARP